jgi:uracil-DNA glycosylase
MDIDEEWAKVLKEELESPYMKQLAVFLEEERGKGPVYPSKEDVFAAFAITPFDKVKVVIVGQDPYHGKGQAHGLSFSVPKGVKPPPSLKNIYKELYQDLGIDPPEEGCLTSWAKQGVFLLNSILTVRAKEPKSHHQKGWERFTDSVIEKLSQRKDPIVFLLWGKSAQQKCEKILSSNHHKVFIAAHPSPYSAHNFLGCSHFSKTNECLRGFGKSSIDWKLQ